LSNRSAAKTSAKVNWAEQSVSQLLRRRTDFDIIESKVLILNYSA
jgi:hypothetical protein